MGDRYTSLSQHAGGLGPPATASWPSVAQWTAWHRARERSLSWTVLVNRSTGRVAGQWTAGETGVETAADGGDS